jgi:hypothetical protein
LKKLSNYEKYQLDWLKQHGHSIHDLIKNVSEYAKSTDYHNEDFYEIFLAWEEEIGFPGREIYACENEYKESEENYDETI